MEGDNYPPLGMRQAGHKPRPERRPEQMEWLGVVITVSMVAIAWWADWEEQRIVGREYRG